MIHQTIDWRELLHEIIIEAGMTGLKQRDIILRLQALSLADPILDHLDALLAEGKVQQFMVKSGPRGGRPATIWRGTTLLLKDNP